PGPRRSDEQNAAWRRQSDLLVDVVVHVRVLDHGVEQPLHFVEPSERGKRRRALLDEELARRARLDLLQAGEAVVTSHLQRSQIGVCTWAGPYKVRPTSGLLGRWICGEEPA